MPPNDPQQPSSTEEPTTSTGRLAHNLMNRRLGTLVSELIKIVAGILISATALDKAKSIVEQTKDIAKAIAAELDGGGAA